MTVVIAAAVLLAWTRYESWDPDSALYATMSARMSPQPASTWLVPMWEGSWDWQGPFREHPAGMFVLPAMLGRTGYPALQAAFAIGALFSALTIILIRPAAAPLVKTAEAVAMQWAALILPIAFVYRVRANQEYPLLVLILVALISTERARRNPMWVIGGMAAAAALTLVKGIFVVFLVGLCALWLLVIPPAGGRRAADGPAWLGVLLSIAAIAITAWLYERAYVRSTGESFLDFYLYQRVEESAGIQSGRAFNLAQNLYNAGWYMVRLVWFAVPGSLVLIASANAWRKASVASRRALWFVLIAAAAYIAATSVAVNKADRFIFPAYYFIGLAGVVVAMRRWPAVDALGSRLAALPALALPLTWLALFMLTILFNVIRPT